MSFTIRGRVLFFFLLLVFTGIFCFFFHFSLKKNWRLKEKMQKKRAKEKKNNPVTIQTLKPNKSMTKTFTISMAFALHFSSFALWFNELSGVQREYRDESLQQKSP